MYVWVLYSTSDTERINEVVFYPFHAVEHGDETNLAGLLSFTDSPQSPFDLAAVLGRREGIKR